MMTLVNDKHWLCVGGPTRQPQDEPHQKHPITANTQLVCICVCMLVNHHRPFKHGHRSVVTETSLDIRIFCGFSLPTFSGSFDSSKCFAECCLVFGFPVMIYLIWYLPLMHVWWGYCCCSHLDSSVGAEPFQESLTQNQLVDVFSEWWSPHSIASDNLKQTSSTLVGYHSNCIAVWLIVANEWIIVIRNDKIARCETNDDAWMRATRAKKKCLSSGGIVNTVDLCGDGTGGNGGPLSLCISI